jgi:hypothetical protein
MKRRKRTPDKPSARRSSEAPAQQHRPETRTMREFFSLGVRLDEFIGFDHEIYKQERNPLYVWLHYLDCRMEKQPVDEWVLEYFDRVARRLERLAHQPPRRSAPAIAEALEMKGPVFTHFHRVDGLALRIADKIRGPAGKRRMSDYQAIKEVSAETKISKKTLIRAWQKFKYMAQFQLGDKKSATF